MAKVTVVTKHAYSSEMDDVFIVGVFSNDQDALKYCEINDPTEESLSADEFEIDALLEDEFKRELMPGHPCRKGGER